MSAISYFYFLLLLMGFALHNSYAKMTTTNYKIEMLNDSRATLGEGPHWDNATQSLYYVDIVKGTLLRYSYQQNKIYRAKIEGEELAGFVIPVEGAPNEYAVGCGRRVVIVNWNGSDSVAHVVRTLFEVQPEQQYAGNRFNDGKCDPRGRLFAGTMRYIGDEMSSRMGELYKYEMGGKVTPIKSNIGISNGLAWDEKINKFYYIDTLDYEVKAYNYDMETGVPANPKVICDLRQISSSEQLLPDGMTIDADGNIYVATYNGHTIYKIDPSNGKVLLELKLPCKQITSAAFGGPNLDVLFVTTSANPDLPEPAGATFKITNLGVKGLPMSKIRV